MSNENSPETPKDGKENMSQLTGKPEGGQKSGAAQDRKAATHSLADVAAARTAKVGKPIAGSTGLSAKGIHAWFGKKACT
jgi:phosphate transport system ATP-binding protein